MSCGRETRAAWRGCGDNEKENWNVRKRLDLARLRGEALPAMSLNKRNIEIKSCQQSIFLII